MSPEASRHASIAGSLDTVPRRDPWGHPKQIDVMQCLTQCINVAEKAGRYWKIHNCPMTSTKICLQSSSLCQDFHQIPWLSDVSENVWVWSWLIDNIEPKQPKQLKQLKLAETALKHAKICQVSRHRSKGDEISELGLLSWNSLCLTWVNNNKHVNGKEKWSKVVQSGLQKSWSDSFTKLKLLRFRCFNSTFVTEQLGPERRRFRGTHLCRCNTLASVLSYGIAKSMIINVTHTSSSHHQIIKSSWCIITQDHTSI